ncbi:hypothetical protein Tco_1093067 [Tanacetum coccineum]|uniref:Uncharacterized protein n=1 Tax=Tanacetum coccineum TaxID=301880 RepID=A0ABQ5ICY2_9ASTR
MRFLNEIAPQVELPKEGQPSNAQAVQAVEAWKHSNFLCHNYVLNGLVDSLYNVYCKTTTAKELWNSLECKYKTEDASTNKIGKSSRIEGRIMSKIKDNKKIMISKMKIQRSTPKKRGMEPRAAKGNNEKFQFGPDFVSFMVENEPTSYREEVTSSELLNGKKPLKVK